MKCEICQKEFKNYRALGIHIVKTHNISSKEYYDLYLKKENEGICPVCSKFTNFFKLSKGYAKFCSIKCVNNSVETKEKIKKTCLERYGVENPYQFENFKEKIKQTCLERYGTEHPAQNKEIQEKTKKVWLEKYGVENYTQSNDYKVKTIQTNLEKYGVKYTSQNKEIREKQKQTCLERYGVENPSQSEIIKEKTKETNLKRYGVENPSQNKQIQEKIKQTNLEKYGVENYTKTNEYKDKCKKTSLVKYGVEFPTQSDKVKQKQKQSCLKKYGVNNYSKTIEYKEKVKKTCLEKYNIEHPFQNKEKIKETNLERYGIENYLQSCEFKEKKKNETIEKYKKEFPQLNIIDYNINTSIMTCYCNECNKNYNIGIMMLGSRLRHLKYKNPCTNCFPIDGHYSNKEKELVDYIKSIYNGNIIENDRNILNGKELDIYLPDLKLAFEYNGLYWHSSEYKDREYHLNKTIECDKQGIQLLHIFENEWIENQNEFKKYIKEIINNDINVNSMAFKKEENNIIVNRSLNNGKILETLGYKLNKVLEPQKINIIFENKRHDICDCGKLIYKLT